MSPERPSDSAALELRTVRVAVTKVIDTVPLRLAVHRGLFIESGLRVELVEMPSQRLALAALRRGEVEVAFGGNIALLRAAADGAELELQCEAYISGTNTMALVALPGMGYQDPGTNLAPTIAVDPDDDLGKLATTSRLAIEGIDPTDIEFLELSFDEMMTALGDRRADAAWLTEPRVSRAQKEFGAEIVTDTGRGAMQSFPMSSYAADAEVVAANPNTFAQLRRSLAHAQGLAADHGAVREGLRTFTALDQTTAALVALGTFPTSVNSVRLQRVADLMHNSGLLTNKLDVNDMVPSDAPTGS